MPEQQQIQGIIVAMLEQEDPAEDGEERGLADPDEAADDLEAAAAASVQEHQVPGAAGADALGRLEDGERPQRGLGGGLR